MATSPRPEPLREIPTGRPPTRRRSTRSPSRSAGGQPTGAQPGVRLNGVSPGPVETPLLEATRHDPVFGPFVDTLPIPLGRSAQPAEIAGVVAFVLSPESAVMHGSIVVVDGGTDALMRPEDV